MSTPNLMFKLNTVESNSRNPRDDFPTPKPFTEILLDRVPLVGSIFEPAAGRGDMLRVIQERYPHATGNDLLNGYDFLTDNDGMWDNIITNPPYSVALKFVVQSIARSRRVAALLLPYYWIVAKRRRDLFNNNCSRIIVVADRMIVETPKGLVKSVFNHVWCVFEPKVDGRRPTFEVV